MEMTSNRPYVLRALHEWILDNGMTPYILVNAEHSGVSVPPEYINEGKVVLNISPGAVKDLSINNDYISFSARFSGVPFEIFVPLASVLAVYAKENGKGMIFPEEEATAKDGEEEKPMAAEDKRPNLKVVK